MAVRMISALQAALKGQAPIAAIPIEGHAPFCIDRPRIAKWAKGVEITSVEAGENRWLTIRGEVKRERKDHWGTQHYVIKTLCRIPAIQRHKAMLEISKWADRERAKRNKVIAQGATNAAMVRAAKLKAMEADQPEIVELDGARRALWSIKAEITRRINQPKPFVADRWHQTENERLRKRWINWRNGKKARGIQGKRQRERLPEMRVIDAEYARIVPPHRGKGSRREMTAEEKARAQELRRQRDAIRSYIMFEATWESEQHYYGNPAKAARESSKVYKEPTPRPELAKELVVAKHRLAEAERMMRLFEAEKAAMALEPEVVAAKAPRKLKLVEKRTSTVEKGRKSAPVVEEPYAYLRTMTVKHELVGEPYSYLSTMTKKSA